MSSFTDIVVNGSAQVDPVMVTLKDMAFLVVLVLVIVFLWNHFHLDDAYEASVKGGR
jgi:hypothetical protein